MALDRFEVRVSIQKVLLGLVLVIVPLSIVGLYLTSQSDSALESSIGGHLKAMAQMHSNDLAHMLGDRIAAIKLIAADPSVVEAVSSANRGYQNQNEAAISERIDKGSKAWSTPEAANTVKTLLASRPSEILRHYHEMDPGMIRIVVTDEHGVPIAATAKPSAYNMAQNEAWHSVYAEGKGATTVSNILYDDANKAYFVEVGIPVAEANTNRVAGVAIASVNITPLLQTFQQDALADGSKMYLVNDDGTVVSGPRTDVFARARSEEFGAIRDSLGTAEGRQIGYVTADLRNGRRLIAFADTGLQKMYKNLGWTVLISQDERQATAPLRMLSQFAILMVVLALFMVTLLSVYYMLHRKQRFEDIESVVPARAQTA